MRNLCRYLFMILCCGIPASALADYVNFEVSHVHPIALTPSGQRLLVVNTPDALLEVFAVEADGGLSVSSTIPVGLEPVTVVARTDSEAWVVNHLSDSVSIVDLASNAVVRTLRVGDEPTDVAFANGRAFVSVATEDAIRVFNLADLDAAPTQVSIFGRKPRALAVSNDGSTVYAVVLLSGNQTTIVSTAAVWGSPFGDLQDPDRLDAFGLQPVECNGAPPAYPPLPPGITRNPALTFPASGVPEVSLILRWNGNTQRWEDEAGQDWNHCIPYRLPDHDLFAIDSTTLGVTEVDHVGTTLFDVSVHPANGKIYVPNTEARNFVRFEHPLGVRGHPVDNRFTIVDPADGFAKTFIDLNTHINRSSNPATNLAERLASISQPGQLVWNAAGTSGYVAGLGSAKLFRVDGTCISGSCIFGAERAAPSAADVGQGPSGVALLEAKQRAYVLNRFDNSISIVDTKAMSTVETVTLHDPSSATIKNGRRLLYDAVLTSGHGDAACSSCHISGDRDGQAWDLGDPTGSFVPYTTTGDNVRFIDPNGGAPFNCPPGQCSGYSGFDPQKGPMTTQTLRGMLEPLHWRGDRATVRDFNMAFVGLMGTADIGPINGKPAGLSAEDMQLFRQFSLGIQYPPNPFRNVDDTLPETNVPVPGDAFSGNPARGRAIYDDRDDTDGGGRCVACHTRPFGAAGGTLGGVEPQEPTTLAAAGLFNGFQDLSLHSDLKVPHLRNMYEKFGPRFGNYDAKTGFGYGHDGSFSTLGAFFSDIAFDLSNRDARDVSAFMAHFPTGTRPAIGQHLTLPAGAAPTGSTSDEALLATLITLGDLTSPTRHCELVASAPFGDRLRRLHLRAGAWVTDIAGEPTLTTAQLRQSATGPLSFLCVTLGSGVRLGGDRDEDLFLDGDDCAEGDPGAWAAPRAVSGLSVTAASSTQLSWDEQAGTIGDDVTYEVLSGTLSDLRLSSGWPSATACVTAVVGGSHADTRAAPAVGDGYYYLVRARNVCGLGTSGAGRSELDALDCPSPLP